MSDLEGAMLSDYLLLTCVNKGGVADVYRARSVVDGSGASPTTLEVAVKIFRSGYAQREAFRDYFMSEAEKIGQLDHPNILPFLEYGEGEDLLYLVTPFVESGTLEDLLQRVGGRLSPMQALPIVEQLCNAIQYAHDAGVAHGNIKPSNVFVASDGRMLLSDFGIARGYDDSQQSLTRVGWGSAEYAAPEQSLGVLRPTSDIYSSGVLFFRVLTGSPPFTGQTPVEVLLKHVRQSPPSARSLVPQISVAVDAVLMKALQKRSDERFSSAREFGQAYAQAVLVSPVASPIARAVVTKTLLHPSGQRQAVMEPQTPTPIIDRYTVERISVATWQDAMPQQELSLPDTPVPVVDVSRPDVEREPAGKDEEREARGERAEVSNTSLHWSVDPLEWSPIAKEEGTIPGVPLTANRYLEEKPGVSTPVEAVVSEAQTMAIGDEVQTVSRTGLRRWLPIIVVVLLLIGLLGAILSAFFYPDSSSGADMSRYVLALYGNGLFN